MDGSTEEPKEKRKGLIKAWRITKVVLGYVLPILIVGSLPLTIWLVARNAENTDSQSNQGERWKDLLANWEEFQERGEKLGYEPVDTHLFTVGLCHFGDYQYTWNESETPEAAGFICGDVIVPLDHNQPDGETIFVTVAIWPTYDEPHYPDPLFITQGGPGASTLEMYPEYLYPKRSGGERDLVFVEQRGTRFSDYRLECSYTNWEESLPEGDDPDDYEMIDFLTSCRKELLVKGVNLNAYTTPQIARDFELVRKALGYDEINFYGVSYGTLVGQYLATYFPDSLRTLVLDGVVTLPLDFLNQSLDRFDRVLTQLAESCQQDPECARAYPDLIARFDKLVQQMDADPRTIHIKYPDSLFPSDDTLDGESFYYFFLRMFYYDHSFAFLPYIMEQAEKNNFDLLEAMTEHTLELNLVQSGMYFSVICSEHKDFADIQDETSHLVPAGVDWEGETRQEFRDVCDLWDVKKAPDRLEVMPKSDIPALLMSGQFDPVTPPANGDLVLRSFSNGQHLIDPVGGHGVIFSDSCTKSILMNFLNKPNKEINAECLDDADRRTLAVPPNAVSSPFMYKIMSSDSAYPLMMVVPILLIILMIFRSAGNYFAFLWKNMRGKLQVLDESTKRLKLSYELVSWIFALASLGLAIGFTVYFDRAYEVPSYLYALAMPGGVRMILIIPWMLVLILPFALYFGVRMYIKFPSILKRVRYIWQAAYCLSATGFLIWSGLLWAWAK